MAKIKLDIFRFDEAVDDVPHRDRVEVEIPDDDHGPRRARDGQGRSRRLDQLPPLVPLGDLRLVLDEHQRHHRTRLQDHCKDVIKADSSVSVDPMPNFQPMKDLVVHMDPFWDKYSRLKPYLQPKDADADHATERRVSPEDMKKLVAVANCVMCATCYALCPVVSVDPAFAGPAAIAYAYRFIEDVRDAKRKERTAQISEDYLWLCAHCYACSYCPKHVDPNDRIIDVKRAAIRTR